MLLAGVSVVFKQIASNYKAVYEPSLKSWAKATSGLTENGPVGEWIMMNKPAVKAWIAQQSDVMQSALIIVKIVKGIVYERKLAAQSARAIA